jgi:hypothetical protein
VSRQHERPVRLYVANPATNHSFQLTCRLAIESRGKAQGMPPRPSIVAITKKGGGKIAV